MIQRLIAQGVVWAMLAGLCVPLAPAAAMPHACCLQHQKHCQEPHQAGISSRNCSHECCRGLAISTAFFTPVALAAHGSLTASPLRTMSGAESQPFAAHTARCERAPPLAG